MYNLPLWYQHLSQTITKNNCSVPSFSNSVQPMEIQITMHPKSNIDFLAVAKDFVEKYFDANKLGISLLGHYYNAQSIFSINLHNNGQHMLFELMGHSNFTNKLAELGIFFIKYYDLACTTQPVGKSRLLITIHGKVDINGSHHNMITTLTLRITDGTPRISNHILEIFI